MPSPDALSPSGLKSNSQFYASYEGGNARRRPSQEPVGKIVKEMFQTHSRKISVQISDLHLSLYIITSLAEVFKKCLRNLTSA